MFIQFRFRRNKLDQLNKSLITNIWLWPFTCVPEMTKQVSKWNHNVIVLASSSESDRSDLFGKFCEWGFPTQSISLAKLGKSSLINKYCAFVFILPVVYCYACEVDTFWQSLHNIRMIWLLFYFQLGEIRNQNLQRTNADTLLILLRITLLHSCFHHPRIHDNPRV